MISAKITADSKNEFGNRITTMQVTFPRFILAELNTHRMLSKNSASSRAIPFAKMVKSVEENPFIPLAWQKDHSGMQGTEYISDPDVVRFYEDLWLDARDNAINAATAMNGGGQYITKQLCNRLLEPFAWHTVLITATEWENFFALRCPQYSLFSENIPMQFRSKKDLLKYVKQVEAEEFKNQYDNLTNLDWLQINKAQAEIHMMALAEAMWDAYNESEPKLLKAGEWHIPFGDQIDKDQICSIVAKAKNIPKPFVTEESLGFNLALIKIATAINARISYTVVGQEGKPANYEADIKLHDRLLASGHMSPTEHCAKAMSEEERWCNVSGERAKTINGGYGMMKDESFGWSGNFRGFIQYRKTIPGENKTK